MGASVAGSAMLPGQERWAGSKPVAPPVDWDAGAGPVLMHHSERGLLERPQEVATVAAAVEAAWALSTAAGVGEGL